MPSKPETFAQKLREHRKANGMSVRDLAAIVEVSPSLISRFEHGKKAAGPVTLEKLADGLKLVGNERSDFIESGTSQSVRTAQAFGPNMVSPFFRSVLCDLLRTLGLKGEVRGFQTETPTNNYVYDLVVTMVDGTILGLEFKPGRILVAYADPMTGRLPSPTAAAVLAAGGFNAEITIRRAADKP